MSCVRDSTKRKIESIHSESEKYTHTKREKDCKTCKDCFSNTLIHTFSVVSQSVQVCRETQKEMFTRHTTPLNEKSGKIASVHNTSITAKYMNHADEVEKMFGGAFHCTYTIIKSGRL